MDYESFRAAWAHALDESRLPTIGLHATEMLDTRNLDRTYLVYVEPLGGQDAPPFHVTAELSWSWQALHTARAATNDNDILSEMLGRDQTEDLVTEKPYIRVDIKLVARAPYDKPLPMPSRAAWAKWVEETVERLDHVEPLLPEEILRENRMGMMEVLAWQDSPTAIVVCESSGQLLLEAVEVSAGQAVELPRIVDGEPDDGPEAQLAALLQRVRASLSAWMQAVDHLRPR